MVSIGDKNWWTPSQHVSKSAAEQNMNHAPLRFAFDPIPGEKEFL